MSFENKGVRQKMARARVFQWEVAEQLGISEPTLTRWLRRPLTPERLERIEAAIVALKREREEGTCHD